MAQPPILIAPTLPGGNLISSIDGITFSTFTPLIGPTSFQALLNGQNVIYAIDSAAQIWQSFDFGNTWTKIGAPAPNGVVNAAGLFFRTSLGTWLVANGVGGDTAQIQRSVTNGQSWTTVRPIGVSADNWVIRYLVEVQPLGLLTQRSLFFGVDDNTNGARSGLWKSTDDGQTWAQVDSLASIATVGFQFIPQRPNGTGGGYWIVFSSVNQNFGITRALSGTQFAYAPSTNPDAAIAPVDRADGNAGFLCEGTDAILRSWSTGGDEFHATEANVDANTWTAGPLAVANAPSSGAVVIRGDQFFGANVALAHWVVSQNHGTTWTDTGLSIGPARKSILIPGGGIPQFPGTGSAQDPGEVLAYGSIARGQMAGQ